MSAPPPEEYLAPEFDSTTLKIPQLRSLLLQYGVPYSSTAKKGDLVQAFEDGVRSQAATILASAAAVRPSARGITDMSDIDAASASGSRSGGRRRRATSPHLVEDAPPTPPKRPRGRPRKTLPTEAIAAAAAAAAAEPSEEVVADVDVPAVPAPAAPRPRGRPRKSVLPVEPAAPAVVQEDAVVVTSAPVDLAPIAGPVAPVKRGRGRPRKSVPVPVEPIDDGAEAEAEDNDDGTPIVKPATPVSPASHPKLSAPSSSRRKSNIAPSTHIFDRQTPLRSVLSTGAGDSSDVGASSRRQTIRIMDVVKDHEEEGGSSSDAKGKMPKTPRRSTGEDESGFSDYNPFQSGGEEAQDRERRRRKSSMGSVRAKGKAPRLSEPIMADSPTTSALRRMGPSRENLKTPPKDIKEKLMAEAELERASEYNNEVSSKLQRISSYAEPVVHVESHVTRAAPASDDTSSSALIKRAQAHAPATVSAARSALPLSVLVMLLLSFLTNWKHQSAAIGFCDTSNTTNDVVLARESAISEANRCIDQRARLNAANPHSGDHVTCDASVLPLVPFLPRPTACAACPPHAVCEDGQLVACEPEYLLTPHPLAALAPLADGLPSVGPRAFPPSCRPDTARKRLIGNLAKQMEGELARGRGYIVCSGLDKPADKGKKISGDGERYGVEERVLKQRFEARKDPKFSQEQFEEVFEAALKDLVDHGDVVESIDAAGRSFYAATRTEMTLTCRAKLEMISLLEQWKKQLGGTLATVLMIAYLRSTILSRREEKHTADELAAVVLKRLQDQERLHYTDPATTPSPFLKPEQLRDLVLPHSGSPAYKARLWQAVTDRVEKNANIRAREQEVGGEVWNTWEWAGVGVRLLE